MAKGGSKDDANRSGLELPNELPQVTPPHELKPTDIRFLVVKLSTQVERLITDVHSQGEKIDGLRDKIDEVKGEKFDLLRDKIDGVKDSLASAKVWALLLYIGLAAVLLGVLARGFKWL